MNILRALVFFTLFSLVAGCKVAVVVSSGGDVQSQSGTRDCAGGNSCEFDVVDANFDDTFTAVAKPGYVFAKWEQGLPGSRFLCKGSTNPVCRVVNAPLNALDIDILIRDYGEIY